MAGQCCRQKTQTTRSRACHAASVDSCVAQIASRTKSRWVTGGNRGPMERALILRPGDDGCRGRARGSMAGGKAVPDQPGKRYPRGSSIDPRHSGAPQRQANRSRSCLESLPSTFNR